MNKKVYPKAVILKKGIVGVVILGACGLLALIMMNFYHANSKKKTQETSATVKSVEKKSSDSDENWYQNRTISKPAAGPAVVTKSPVAKGGVETKANGSVASVVAEAPTKPDPKTQQEQDNLYKAMSASINTNQLVADPKYKNGEGGGVGSDASSESSLASSSPDNDQNKQSEKIAFLKDAAKSTESDYLKATLKNPVSPYELQAGTIIPGVLVTGINSDLPGQVTGQVKSNVYDSISGNYLLVPQGAKLIGAYASKVSYGQERALVVWNRIIFPNGQNIDLQGMSGVDMSGYAGFTDQVNNHYGKIFGSVILMSMLSAGAQLAQPQNDDDSNDNPSVNQTMAQSLGTNISAVGTAMTMKNLSIQPTLEIRQGYEFNIEVKKDMIFDSPYQDKAGF